MPRTQKRQQPTRQPSSLEALLELAAWWWWTALVTPYVITYAFFGGGMIPPRKEPVKPSKAAPGPLSGTPEQFADAADAFVKSLPVPDPKQEA